ncbi:MAG: hypothetical protein F6K42_22495 [Leptolyngbya sp. SIO1D8]|nr:hypothetical protein [Leptolyngbya sp. SIO1D8]
MSPVGHRFLENVDSNDPQFAQVTLLAKQFSKVLEYNSRFGFEDRLKFYWNTYSPISTISSLRDCAFGAVLNEVWFAFFAEPCPNPEIMIKAARNILMVVKDWETVDLITRLKAIELVFNAVEVGLNPQLNLNDLFSDIHEVIFALMVSAIDELSEGFAHTLVCLIQNPFPPPTSPDEFTMATYEALRLYPLFTASTRPDLENRHLYRVNYLNYHRRRDLFGQDAHKYNWQRWRRKNLLSKTLIFGIGNNRACPGRNSAIQIIPTMVRVWLESFRTESLILHDRQLSCGGLAVVTSKDERASRPLSWLHFVRWIYNNIVFFGGKKWWVKHRNVVISKKLAEADHYYKAISQPPKLEVAIAHSTQ